MNLFASWTAYADAAKEWIRHEEAEHIAKYAECQRTCSSLELQYLGYALVALSVLEVHPKPHTGGSSVVLGLAATQEASASGKSSRGKRNGTGARQLTALPGNHMGRGTVIDVYEAETKSKEPLCSGVVEKKDGFIIKINISAGSFHPEPGVRITLTIHANNPVYAMQLKKLAIHSFPNRLTDFCFDDYIELRSETEVLIENEASSPHSPVAVSAAVVNEMRTETTETTKATETTETTETTEMAVCSDNMESSRPTHNDPIKVKLLPPERCKRTFRVSGNVFASPTTMDSPSSAYPSCLQEQDSADILRQYPHLNASQAAAVAFALRSNDIAGIHGPPGTGKTTTLAAVIHALHFHLNLRVLVAAPSNVAVDNLLDAYLKCARRNDRDQVPETVRIGHSARISADLQKYALPAALGRGPSGRTILEMTEQIAQLKRDIQVAERNEKCKPREVGALKKELSVLKAKRFKVEQSATHKLLSTVPVVFATLPGCGIHLKQLNFDILCVDEAAQSTEVEIWIAAMHAQRIILAGDHYQLSPTVMSTKAHNLTYSLFERCFDLFGSESFSRMLSEQYRMHEDIMTWSSRTFYDSKLRAHSTVASRCLDTWLRNVEEGQPPMMMASPRPLVWLETAGVDENGDCQFFKGLDHLPQAGGSSMNVYEAVAVAGYLRHLRKIISPLSLAGNVIVITPYTAQVTLISQLLHVIDKEEISDNWEHGKRASRLSDVRVATVDGFQGGESPVVVISLVRSNDDGKIGFLSDIRRTNVAVTRAQVQLTVIGNSEILSGDKQLADLYEHFHALGDVWTASEFVDSKDEERAADIICEQRLAFERYVDNERRRLAELKVLKCPATRADSRNGRQNESPCEWRKPHNRGQQKIKASGSGVAKKPEVKSYFCPQSKASGKNNRDRTDGSEMLVTDIDIERLICEMSERNFLSTFINMSGRRRKLIHTLAEKVNPVLVHLSKGEGCTRELSVHNPQHPTSGIALIDLENNSVKLDDDACRRLAKTDASTTLTVSEFLSVLISSGHGVRRNEVNRKVLSEAVSGPVENNFASTCAHYPITYQSQPRKSLNLEMQSSEDRCTPRYPIGGSDKKKLPNPFALSSSSNSESAESDDSDESEEGKGNEKANLVDLLDATAVVTEQPDDQLEDGHTDLLKIAAPTKANLSRRVPKSLPQELQPKNDDALIDELRIESTKCHDARCKEKTTWFSLTCPHCKHLFCSTHGLPEAHGCGARAHAAARRALRGPLIETSVKAHQKATAKLSAKLQKAAESRKPKTKKNK